MQITVPPELESLIQKRLSSGVYASVEDVLRQALEAQEFEEDWLRENREAIEAKIDRAIDQIAAGRVYGPEEGRQKLAAMRAEHLAKHG